MPDIDYVAKAKAAINAADQTPKVIAAVIYAQAIDRHIIALQANTDACDDLARIVRIADENAHHRSVNRR